jgi:hypothetical protein
VTHASACSCRSKMRTRSREGRNLCWESPTKLVLLTRGTSFLAVLGSLSLCLSRPRSHLAFSRLLSLAHSPPPLLPLFPLTCVQGHALFAAKESRADGRRGTGEHGAVSARQSGARQCALLVFAHRLAAERKCLVNPAQLLLSLPLQMHVPWRPRPAQE